MDVSAEEVNFLLSSPMMSRQRVHLSADELQAAVLAYLWQKLGAQVLPDTWVWMDGGEGTSVVLILPAFSKA